MSDEAEDALIEKALMVMLEEYRMLNSEVTMFVGELLKVPVFAVAIVAFIFGIKGSEGFTDFSRLLGAPVLAGLIFYVAFLYYSVTKSGRYRAVVEKKINKLLGGTYLRWNSQVTKSLEWYTDGSLKGARKLSIIFHPMYLCGLFGVFVIIAVALLLMTGRLTPAQVWGRSAAYWMSAVLLIALFSLLYVITYGRSNIERRINELVELDAQRTKGSTKKSG